jgi:hypothetical protein
MRTWLRNVLGASAAVVSVASITAAFCLPASASTRPVHRAGSCSASGGDFVDCSFDAGSRYRPGTYHLKVTASPNQAVDVFWDISCDKGTAPLFVQFGDRSGSFTQATPFRRILPHPLFHPAHCDAFVDVSLSGFSGGSVHASLTYTRWDGR